MICLKINDPKKCLDSKTKEGCEFLACTTCIKNWYEISGSRSCPGCRRINTFMIYNEDELRQYINERYLIMFSLFREPIEPINDIRPNLPNLPIIIQINPNQIIRARRLFYDDNYISE